jgi:peptide/nickel transport system substrate-binding protein
MELKSITASVYFSSDAANPDTARKFYADIEMYTSGAGAPPDPEGLMRQFLSSEIATKENKWQRSNATRWHDEAYDNLFHAAEGELDPVKRAALFIAMNDMVVENGVVIPVVCRPQVSAISEKLRATLSGWDSTFWNLKDWYREA